MFNLSRNSWYVLLTVLVLVACQNTSVRNEVNKTTATSLPTGSSITSDHAQGIQADKDANVIQCSALPYSRVCTLNATPKPGESLWLYGDVLAGETVYQNGGIEIDDTGKIVDVGCISSPSGATVLSCPYQVISPGLINPHDHLSYNQNFPGGQNNDGGASNPHYKLCNDPQQAFSNPLCASYRYNRRNEWRKGLEGKPAIIAPWGGTDESKAWNELRHVMAGATTVAGSGGQIGLVRNPDVLDLMEGLKTSDDKYVDYNTFPLGDTKDVTGHNYGNCHYPKVVDTSVSDNLIFLPHVAEGINEFAHNELYCLSGKGAGSVNVEAYNSSFIHTVAAIPTDGENLKNADMTAVWSPRSNISLYGNTAQVTLYDTLGVRLTLSSDWTPSGSINMMRELACAYDFNQNYLNRHFSKQYLWKMVTEHAARALGIDDQVGVIAKGQWADIAIYNAIGKVYTSYYDPMIKGGVEDVSLVLRAGQPLYGQQDIVNKLDTTCETLSGSVCGTSKAACVKETGYTLAQIYAANTKSYPLYFCGTPGDEPSCVPARYKEYSGAITSSDKDGDGIANQSDNCVDVFNPIRPMDNSKQADYNNNGIGDACDPNPL